MRVSLVRVNRTDDYQNLENTRSVLWTSDRTETNQILLGSFTVPSLRRMKCRKSRGGSALCMEQANTPNLRYLITHADSGHCPRTRMKRKTRVS